MEEKRRKVGQAGKYQTVTRERVFNNHDGSLWECVMLRQASLFVRRLESLHKCDQPINIFQCNSVVERNPKPADRSGKR